MPAIHYARLKKQTESLAVLFSKPDTFISQLNLFLEQYADGTHRPSYKNEAPSLLSTYNVPIPVCKQLFIALKPYCKKYPQDILNLCNQLWQEPYLETRKLAISLLGEIPSEQYRSIIKIIQDWVATRPEESLLHLLLEQGIKEVSGSFSSSLLDLTRSWLEDTDSGNKKIGFYTLLSLIKSPGFTNYPALFHLLTPHLRKIPLELRSDVIDLCVELAHQTPGEMAYILQLNLVAPNNPDAAWLIRQVLDAFPPHIYHKLKQVISGLRTNE